MKFREFDLDSGIKIILGKDSETNDELMKEYSRGENLVIHTIKPGSPFCILEEIHPSKTDLKDAAIICASRSQDWRDNKKDVFLHIFKRKNAFKKRYMKNGTWGIKGKPKRIKVNKEEIEKWQSEKSN